MLKGDLTMREFLGYDPDVGWQPLEGDKIILLAGDSMKVDLEPIREGLNEIKLILKEKP